MLEPIFETVLNVFVALSPGDNPGFVGLRLKWRLP
jgi:hypothetical protein